MVDFNQFGSFKPGEPDDPQHCAQCESMLVDALDGALSPADQRIFERHMAGCPSCSTMLAEAQRGAAWMDMLKTPRPEPPADLLARILDKTSVDAERRALAAARPDIVLGTTDYIRVPAQHVPNTLLSGPMLVAGRPGSPYVTAQVLPFRARIKYAMRSIGQTMLQPRLAMTAAMAFFSIALTMNLTGIRLSGLRASDLKPSSILRSCYEAKARVVRYSDNLRVVYELESRVRELQRSTDDDGSTSPAPQTSPKSGQQPDDDKQDKHKHDDKTPGQPAKPAQNSPGSSRRDDPANTIRVADQAFPGHRIVVDASEFVALTPVVNKQEGGLV